LLAATVFIKSRNQSRPVNPKADSHKRLILIFNGWGYRLHKAVWNFIRVVKAQSVSLGSLVRQIQTNNEWGAYLAPECGRFLSYWRNPDDRIHV
jgi:hypothetical protein